jgi:CheY-like chemotaxis protein
MDNDISEGLPQGAEEVRARISQRISEYLADRGVHERKQAAHVAEVTGLSVMHARRKLAGGPSWSIEECMVIANHHGDSLGALLALPERGAQGLLAICEVQIGALWYAASADIGPRALWPKAGDLVAVRTPRRWRVMPYGKLLGNVSSDQVYSVLALSVRSSACANIHIAVLDDDATVAQTVRDGLISAGFAVVAFTSASELQAEIEQFDVFILDFFLDGDQTATALIESIREIKPDALILVLTGRAREGADAELAHQIRVFKVQMYEKPARIAYIESEVEAWMDQIHQG